MGYSIHDKEIVNTFLKKIRELDNVIDMSFNMKNDILDILTEVCSVMGWYSSVAKSVISEFNPEISKGVSQHMWSIGQCVELAKGVGQRPDLIVSFKKNLSPIVKNLIKVLEFRDMSSCWECGKDTEVGVTLCDSCIDYHREYNDLYSEGCE